MRIPKRDTTTAMPCRHFRTIILSIVSAAVVVLPASPILSQNYFGDRLYPRSDDWSVQCKIFTITETAVVVMFPGHSELSEIRRSSLRKIEYEDGRQVVFNALGQIEGEIAVSRYVLVRDVLNPGLLKLANGEEVVLNGIDFSLPSDSLSLYYFNAGTDYVRSLLLNRKVQLQFDFQRRDEFGRLRAYVILPGGLILNADLIKRGYCPLDRGRMLIYLDDFSRLEEEAQRERRGIWNREISLPKK